MIANGTTKETTTASNDSIGGCGGSGGGGGRGARKASKDAQKQIPEKPDNFASALEMTKVNSTLNAFVGGRQKSWMWNNNAISTPGGIPVPTTIRSQVGSIKRRMTPTNKQRPTQSAAGKNTVTINDDREPPLLATVGPGKSPPSTAPSSLSPDLRGSGLPPKRRAPAGSMETVLPSPAPSDTPSATDQREDEDEVATPQAAARDTPIASPAAANDNEADQTYGERQDEQSSVVDARGDQTELSSGNGELNVDAATMENSTGVEERRQHTSAKRSLDTVDEGPEYAKRQKQSPLLPLPDRTDADSSSTQTPVARLDEQGAGARLSNRAQSPVIIDSRQTSPVYAQPNIQSPSIPQNQTPTIPSNVVPVVGHNRTPLGPPLQSPRMPSGGNSLPPLYSASLPPATSSPLAHSPMITNTAPPYGSPNIVFPSLPPDQHSWLPQEVVSPYQDSGMPSPGLIRNQQQQQLLQEQAQNPARRQPVQQLQQLPGPEYLTKLTTHLPRFDQYIHAEGGTGLRQFNSVECFRFRIVREAITKDDWFFTILNQVYALMSTAQDVLLRETDIAGNLPGFKALPDILHDNQRLSGRNLIYLAAFPMPIEEAKQRLSFFPALLRQVRDFLNAGYKVIADMKNYYFKRGKVPTAEEIEHDWNVRSPVFRHILIRYLQHHVTKMLEIAHQARSAEQQKLLEHQHMQLQQRQQQLQAGQQLQVNQQQQQQAAVDMIQQLRQQRMDPDQLQQPQNMQMQGPPPQVISPTQNQNFQAEMASRQRGLSANQQHQQMLMNAQVLQSDQGNREYLQMAHGIVPPGQPQQPQPQRPVPQRSTSQTQRLSNPNSRRGSGVSASLSIDTERAQQQLVARLLEGGNNRNYPYQPGSANTSPMSTPTTIPMASPQYGSPLAMQQQPNGPTSRRNSQAQPQRQIQIQPASAGRRVSSTPAQQTFQPPPQQQPGPPVRRQSYTAIQSQPMMVPDAILNSVGQNRPPNWPQQANDALMSGQQMPQMPQMPNQIQSMPPTQQQQQQQGVNFQQDDFMGRAQVFANGLPRQPNGVIPTPMPIRTSYAGFPQYALQSHLLSPRFAEPPRVNGRPPPRSKLYISITGFAFPGIVIDFKHPCQKVKFNVEEDTEKRLSKMRLGSKPGDGLTRPMVVPGSLIYRLRAIKWTKDETPGAPNKEWVERETDWPSNTFIEVNGNRIELRRKPAWGKDLPADITTHIRAGENEIKVAVLRPRQSTPATTLYAMAVEVHECSHEDDIMASLNHITSADAKTLITTRLVTKDDGDDLMVVDSDELSLAVTCPLSFTLINTPVRAKSCPHLECFDFRNFLDSRPRRKEWEPPNSEAWRCPICRGDARPGELVVDGFLEEVLKTLRETDVGGDDPRHIIVRKDGGWEVKSEKESTGNEKEEKDSNGSAGSGVPKKEVEVICLDDDDD